MPCWRSTRSHHPTSYRWLLRRCPAGEELPGYGGLRAHRGGTLGHGQSPSHLLLVPVFPAGNGYVSARASPGLLPVSNGSTLGKIIPAKSPPPPPPSHGAQLAANSRKPDLRVITSQSGKGLMHHLVSWLGDFWGRVRGSRPPCRVPGRELCRGGARRARAAGLTVPLGFLPVPARADGGPLGSGELPAECASWRGGTWAARPRWPRILPRLSAGKATGTGTAAPIPRTSPFFRESRRKISIAG